ncbi:hypothetical protein [Ammoniphilus sp. CFH 90114]|uniref:hypothetical protein n=1 Tax=Ammoniphilus sp. CFH 90114 TaxID=2493665 RepID=UPI00100E8DA5|nr:hypothetical protein [Ammoniphilus sp. CFH 90114]RXT14861.1 hypothetical protein EIZ39_01220 [Ammoniphilus sp. CFH 90114]
MLDMKTNKNGVSILEVEVVNEGTCEVVFEIEGYDRLFLGVLGRFMKEWTLKYISPLYKDNEPMVDDVGNLNYWAYYINQKSILNEISKQILSSYTVQHKLLVKDEDVNIF